jgi:hypothetical protein
MDFVSDCVSSGKVIRMLTGCAEHQALGPLPLQTTEPIAVPA